MAYEVGDTVFYPNHGAMVIRAIEEKVVRGEKRIYLVLVAQQDSLKIKIPASKVDSVGLRDIIDVDRVKKLVSVFMADSCDEATNWSQRIKRNTEKLSSGDTQKIAEVIRDLTRRERLRALSANEKRLLTQARQILISEIAFARGISEQDATKRLDYVLACICGDNVPADVDLPGGPVPELNCVRVRKMNSQCREAEHRGNPQKVKS